MNMSFGNVFICLCSVLKYFSAGVWTFQNISSGIYVNCNNSTSWYGLNFIGTNVLKLLEQLFGPCSDLNPRPHVFESAVLTIRLSRVSLKQYNIYALNLTD